jgi:hypothetical protein
MRSKTLSRQGRYRITCGRVCGRPDNTFVIVTGSVSASRVLSAVDILRPKLSDPSRHPPPGIVPRPFFEHPVPELTEAVDKTVEFPSEVEDSGLVMIGWRACAFRDVKQTLALNVLHAYLSESEVSILHQRFVEGKASPARPPRHQDQGEEGEEGEEGEGEGEGDCGSVSCGICENGETMHYVAFDAVRAEAVDGIKERLVETLEEVYAQGIDMERMATVIERFHVRHLSALEDAPHETLAHYLTLSLLFAERKDDWRRKLDSVLSHQAPAALKAYDSEAWRRLLREAMLAPPMVCVKAVASPARAAQLAAEEEERMAARVAQLGAGGLEDKQRHVQEAMATNEAPVPDHILKAFKVPSVDSIRFIPLATAVYPPAARLARLTHTREALRVFGLEHGIGKGEAMLEGFDALAEELDHQHLAATTDILQPRPSSHRPTAAPAAPAAAAAGRETGQEEGEGKRGGGGGGGEEGRHWAGEMPLDAAAMARLPLYVQLDQVPLYAA